MLGLIAGNAQCSEISMHSSSEIIRFARRRPKPQTLGVEDTEDCLKIRSDLLKVQLDSPGSSRAQCCAKTARSSEPARVDTSATFKTLRVIPTTQTKRGCFRLQASNHRTVSVPSSLTLSLAVFCYKRSAGKSKEPAFQVLNPGNLPSQTLG